MSFDQIRGITDRHKQLFAIIYARVSSPGQAGDDKGSVLAQRAQRQHAERLGWLPHLIKDSAGDLGRTGAAVAHRSDYIEILEMVIAGLVGAIFVSMEDRIGRDDDEFGFLLKKCIKHDVLIVVDGVVQDPKDDSGWLQLRIRSIFAELENRDRRKRIAVARDARIKAGIAVGRPTMGYVYGKLKRHKWKKHPDPRIRGAIDALFRFYREEGSCPRTAARLRAEEITIPVWRRRKVTESADATTSTATQPRTSAPRHRKNKIDFVDATPAGLVRKLIQHPSYKGEFHSPRWLADKTRDRMRNGQLRTRPARKEETTIIRNNHEPYVSPEEWRRNQENLHDKAFPNPQRCYGDGDRTSSKANDLRRAPGAVHERCVQTQESRWGSVSRVSLLRKVLQEWRPALRADSGEHHG